MWIFFIHSNAWYHAAFERRPSVGLRGARREFNRRDAQVEIGFPHLPLSIANKLRMGLDYILTWWGSFTLLVTLNKL